MSNLTLESVINAAIVAAIVVAAILAYHSL